MLWTNHFKIPNCKHNDFLGCEKDSGKWNLSEGWWTDKNSIIDKSSLSTQDTQSLCQREVQRLLSGMKPERPGWHRQTRTHVWFMSSHSPFHFFLLCSFLHCFYFFITREEKYKAKYHIITSLNQRPIPLLPTALDHLPRRWKIFSQYKHLLSTKNVLWTFICWWWKFKVVQSLKKLLDSIYWY